MNRLLLTPFLALAMIGSALGAVTALTGCDLEGADGTGGAGGDSSDSSSSSSSSGRQGPTRPYIGGAHLFIVNPTDGAVGLHDPQQGDSTTFRWTIPPRQGQWIFVRIYGSGCTESSSCGTLIVEGIADLGAFNFPVLPDAELVLVLDRSGAFFAQSEIGTPTAGNAALRYVGSSLFGTIEGDTLTSLTAVSDVSDQVLVGFDDGEGGYTLLQDGGRPFASGQRYFVEGKRTEPPSLLVCNLSREEPPIGCFDYLLQD